MRHAFEGAEHNGGLKGSCSCRDRSDFSDRPTRNTRTKPNTTVFHRNCQQTEILDAFHQYGRNPGGAGRKELYK